jgi:hypothetical protein
MHNFVQLDGVEAEDFYMRFTYDVRALARPMPPAIECARPLPQAISFR